MCLLTPDEIKRRARMNIQRSTRRKIRKVKKALNQHRRTFCSWRNNCNLRNLWESANEQNKTNGQPQMTYSKFKEEYERIKNERKKLSNMNTTEYERIKKMTSTEFDSYMSDVLSTFINENPWSHNEQSFPSMKGHAGDDAKKIGIFLMFYLIHGKFRVAFTHITFLHAVIDNLISQHGDADGFFALMKTRVAIIEKLSEMRNVRFMKKHNPVLIEKGLLPFKYADDFECDVQDLVARAILNQINPFPYFDKTDDDAEIKGTSNDFCFNQERTKTQVDHPFMVIASDKVSVFVDALGNIYIVGIARGNAPGINSVAHAGGFNDIKKDGTRETESETATREGNEEAIHNITELGITFTSIVKATLYKWWDFRAFACDGAWIGAKVFITYFCKH